MSHVLLRAANDAAAQYTGEPTAFPVDTPLAKLWGTA
jgi:hypothetical protein